MNVITPQTAKKVLPQVLIDAVNELIQENIRTSNGQVLAKVLQKDIKTRTIAKMDHTCFDMRWLDFEPYYEEAGWKVLYCKPDYTEDFDAYFTFSGKGGQ